MMNFLIVLIITLTPHVAYGPVNLCLSVSTGKTVRAIDAQIDCDNGYYSRSQWDGGPKQVIFKGVPTGHCEVVVRVYGDNNKLLREQRSTAEIF